jgi:hypothetical protein
MRVVTGIERREWARKMEQLSDTYARMATLLRSPWIDGWQKRWQERCGDLATLTFELERLVGSPATEMFDAAGDVEVKVY